MTQPSPATPRYSADRPNAPPADDLLGRDAFARRFAQDICAWHGTDSLVMALYGSWGCGKTSLKERILSHLRLEDPLYPILDFNPWQFSGDGDLSGHFLSELDLVLRSGKAGESSAKASKLLRTYTTRISGFAGKTVTTAAPIFAERSPTLSAATAALGEMLTRLSVWLAARREKEDSEEGQLPEIKRALSAMMAKLERPILVTIDDIDRLTADEIPEIFQLVKVNADFPKLIYLLLFDRPVVWDALNKVAPNRGQQYLEKIVQVAYHVPEPPLDKIRDVLFKGLDECIENHPANMRWDQDRWSSLYLDGMRFFFGNLRHVYRFLGSFDFHVRHFERPGGFEVNPVDLLGLETLRVFEPNLYERLFQNKALLTGNHGLRMFDEKKPEEISADVTALLSVVPEATRRAAQHIIQTVFPPTAGDRGDSADEWLRQARACHSDIFEKYFTLQLAVSELGQVDAERIIALAGDREKLRRALREVEGRGLIGKMMDRFDTYKAEVPLTSMPGLVGALCDCADSFPDRMVGSFDFDPLTHAWRVIYFGLKREPSPDNRYDVLRNVFETTDGILLPVKIASAEARRTGEDVDPDREYLISEKQVEQLQRLCVDKLREAAKDGRLRSAGNGTALLWWWSEWDSIEAVREWATAECRDNGGTAWLLSVVTSQGSTNGKPFYFLKWSTLERFVDTAIVEPLALGLDEASLNDKERIGLKQFKRALKRKNAGKSELTGTEWRQDDDP